MARDEPLDVFLEETAAKPDAQRWETTRGVAQGDPDRAVDCVARWLASPRPLWRRTAVECMTQLSGPGATSSTLRLAESAAALCLDRMDAGQRSPRWLAEALWELTGTGEPLQPDVLRRFTGALATARPAPVAATRPATAPRLPPGGPSGAIRRRSPEPGNQWLVVHSSALWWLGLLACCLLGLAMMPVDPATSAASSARQLGAAFPLVAPAAQPAPVQITGTIVAIQPGRRVLRVVDDATRQTVQVRSKEEFAKPLVEGRKILVDGTTEGTHALGGVVVAATAVTLLEARADWGWKAPPAFGPRRMPVSPAQGRRLRVDKGWAK